MKRILLALALCWPGWAVAQPLLVPGRDVAITYRLEGAAADQIPGGAPNGVRLAWDATGQRLRAEPLGRPMYALTDLQRRVTDIVFAGQGAYMEARIKGGDPTQLIAGADVRFTQRGVDRVLGMDCTVWAVRSRKLDATGCVTPDGVILRAEGLFDGRPGRALAESVIYRRQPEREFVPPPGYTRMALPVFK